MRKHYLDNIRWITVLLVLFYHVVYMFNDVGALGGMGGEKNIPALDSMLYFVYPWFMALLFLIAGISSRYALQKKSEKAFLKSRTVKLLVPSTLGLFVFQWVIGFVTSKISPVDIPPFIWPIIGIGPLWFIQMLFIFSLLIVLIRKIDKKDRIWTFCGKANWLVLLLLAVPVWGAAQILNTPMLTMYRFGIYGLVFLLGYFVFSHEQVQNTLEKIRIPLLIAALGLGIYYVITYFGQTYSSDPCLKSPLTNLYLWIAVLAVLGCGKAWLNGTNRITHYMTKSSFGVYVLHYSVLISVCYLLYFKLELPLLVNYLIALVAQFILTFALHEVFRRIPFVRYCVLGVKKPKKQRVNTPPSDKLNG